MPVQPTYPGVYIEEVPSGVRTITGVSTSVAAFIGQFRRGPMDQPVQLFNLGDFERELGGLLATSEASYAIQQFFLNGGSEAWAVRTAGGSPQASSMAIPAAGGGTAFTVQAVHKGTWGDALRVAIDTKTADPDKLFNLAVTEAGAGGRTEIFRNLSFDSTDARFAETVIKDGSKLIQVTGVQRLPLANGTLSGDLPPTLTIAAGSPEIGVKIGGEGPHSATLSPKPTSLSTARSVLESAIRAARPADPAFAGATVEVVRGRQLRIMAGPTAPGARVTFEEAGTDPTAKELGLLPNTATSRTALRSSKSLGQSTALATSSAMTIKQGTATATFTPNATNTTTWEKVRKALETAARQVDAGALVVLYETTNEIRLAVIPSGVQLTFSGGPASDLGLDSPTLVEALLSANLSPFPTLSSASPRVRVKVEPGSSGPKIVALGTKPTTIEGAAGALDTALQAAGFLVRIAAYKDTSLARLVVLPLIAQDKVVFSAGPTDVQTYKDLKLDDPNAANVQLYTLTGGNDGAPPNGTALIGDLNGKTGIYALEKVDLFNILCIPRTAMVSGAGFSPTEASAVTSAAIQYCEKRRAMFLVDTPDNKNEVQEIKDWLAGANLGYKNAALYFPRVQIADPLNEFRLRSVGASGTIAGLYARTDSSRGVWKAPAGTEATLNNVQELDVALSNAENGTLNPLAINTLRNFPVYGTVCWGARTLVGADQMASEWKYVPVRRLALFLEESLYRGTQWVVFEPNDEPLWSQIRLNIGAFLNTLFRQGAFQGKSPREAYLVKCDKETTTQNDINSGVVNILVGFAPLKPAEFVIIRIQQLAGQIQT